MKIYGLDFTSSPSRTKPITCADCDLQTGVLKLHSFTPIASLGDFEAFLGGERPWVAGIDFPFGQPWKLINNMGLPTDWEGYVQAIHENDGRAFQTTIDNYRQSRPGGDKEHLRITDALADSRSPMKFVNPPVARMFFEGAYRLLRSGASIVPCREVSESRRIVVEAYPALVARRFAASYKSDDRKKQTAEKEMARRKIVDGLREDLRNNFGFSVHLNEGHAKQSIEDATGDTLDAVLCAVQADWAYSKRNKNYGIPVRNHPVIQSEGWIVDPRLIAGRTPALEA